MTKEVKLAIEAVARAAGMKVEYGCTYCRETCHSECEPEWHEIVTFIAPALPEGEEEEECVCPHGDPDCELCS